MCHFGLSWVMEQASLRFEGGPKSTSEHPASRTTKSSFLNVTARFVVCLFFASSQPYRNSSGQAKRNLPLHADCPLKPVGQPVRSAFAAGPLHPATAESSTGNAAQPQCMAALSLHPRSVQNAEFPTMPRRRTSEESRARGTGPMTDGAGSRRRSRDQTPVLSIVDSPFPKRRTFQAEMGNARTRADVVP